MSPASSASSPAGERMFQGWGGFPRSSATPLRPGGLDALRDCLRSARAPLLARGAGRSYGDAALNAGGVLLDLGAWNRILDFDAAAGLLRCGAGARFDDLLSALAPQGWFLPVVPGTRFITLGGALACDIHGKNHHRDGSLGRHVLELELLTPEGEIAACSPAVRPAIFWATLGGMGLTGAILSAKLRLLRIPSPWIAQRRIVSPGLDTTLARFDEIEDSHRYSVAWIDALARGRHLGRGVLQFGNHAEPGTGRARCAPARSGPPRLSVPAWAPGWPLSPLAVRAGNAAYFRLHSLAPARSLVPYAAFFFPLDGIGNWNRLYGRRGFAQFQCALPLADGRRGLRRILECASAAGCGSFLSVLKKFGPASLSPLSFPIPGYTLAMDFALGRDVPALLARLESLTLEHGGRVYLAKDAFLQPASLPRMYPRLDEWRQARAELDPRRRWNSDLARRLRLDGD